MTRLRFPLDSIDIHEKKRTDVLVQRLLNFGQRSGTALDLKTADDDTLSAAIEALTLNNSLEDQENDPDLKKFVRSKLYNLKGGFHIRSWNMLEHIYKRDPCPFPTRARGLFTREDTEQPLGEGRHRIVARGYDKFFNVGEVPWTRWDTLPRYSKGPFYLTMKTNGCIIFISALTPTQLLVTSKHAIDQTKPDTELPIQDTSHARMGENWLERHLSSVGLEKADLAQELWDANATAVAELTDDTFEEHVLPTPEQEIGLNLHGINLNHPILYTYPPDLVADCAKRWGFHQTPWITVGSLEDVKRECELIEKDGWPGRDGFIEGVVVRGFLPDDDIIEPDKPRELMFWKVKFEEPYLMYREWRELTRRMLGELDKIDKRQLPTFTAPEPGSQTNGVVGAAMPSSDDVDRTIRLLRVNINKIQNPESKLYAYWTASELLQDPERFSEWKLNRGIVDTRERFLEWRRTPEAQDILDSGSRKPKHLVSDLANRTFERTMLVPIAVPGCGKTSLAVALSSILECAHTQSDDITARRTGPLFIASLKEILLDDSKPNLIFADKNNHLKAHREAIFDLVKELRRGIKVKKKGKKEKGKTLVNDLRQLNTRVIGLVWDVTNFDQDELLSITSKRVKQRGENHQSLRPELTSGGIEIHDVIIKKFLQDFEEFDSLVNQEDESFDQIINLSCKASLTENLRTLISRLHEIIPEQCPVVSDGMLEKAVAKVGEYKAAVKKDMKIDTKFHEPRYFGVRVSLDLQTVISELFSSISLEKPQLLEQFTKRKRFTYIPHITLLHSSELADAQGSGSEERVKDLWAHYRSLATSTEKMDQEIEVVLGPRIVWDDRTMAIEVSSLSPEDIVRWNDRPGHLHSVSHVTVGTISDEIRPIEAGRLLDKALVGIANSGSAGDGIHVIEVPTRVVKGVIRALS